jgi:hypothetical protein
VVRVQVPEAGRRLWQVGAGSRFRHAGTRWALVVGTGWEPGVVPPCGRGARFWTVALDGNGTEHVRCDAGTGRESRVQPNIQMLALTFEFSTTAPLTMFAS